MADDEPPEHLVCPISMEVMTDPVVIEGDEQGHAYERSAVERWFASGRHTVPATNQHLPLAADRRLVAMRALAREARAWRGAGPATRPTAAAAAAAAPGGGAAAGGAAAALPRLLLFAPPNDPSMPRRLVPLLRGRYAVDQVGDAAEGARRAGEGGYAACVAKLGTSGNLGWGVIDALRQAQGAAPVVYVHSATASRDGALRARMARELGVRAFHTKETEDALAAALLGRAAGGAAAAPAAAGSGDEGGAPPARGAGRPSLLLFAPPNDPEMPRRLAPALREHYDVVAVAAAADGVREAATRPYAACVAKLGTKGNLGADVLRALRAAAPRAFVAVHSHTAAHAWAPAARGRYAAEHGVSLWASSASEAELLAALRRVAADWGGGGDAAAPGVAAP